MARARYLGSEPERAPRNVGLTPDAVEMRNLRYLRTQAKRAGAGCQRAAGLERMPERQRAQYTALAASYGAEVERLEARIAEQSAIVESRSGLGAVAR